MTNRSNAVVAWLGGGLLLSVLLTVGLMTLLTADALPNSTTLNSTSTSSLVTTSLPVRTTTTSNLVAQAHTAACRADALTLETAVATSNALGDTVQIETGVTLGSPATYAQGAQARLLMHHQFLSRWPTYTLGYALGLSTTVAGQIDVFVPVTSTKPQPFDSEISGQGCLAL